MQAIALNNSLTKVDLRGANSLFYWAEEHTARILNLLEGNCTLQQLEITVNLKWP